GVEYRQVDSVTVRVSSDDVGVILCQHGHCGCPSSRANADGTGLGRGRLSRQYCEGCRPKGEKLLMRPRHVGQAGVGSPRDRSNERQAPKDGQYSRESPQAAGTSLTDQPCRATTNTHSVLVAAALPRLVRVAEEDLDVGGDGDLL